MLSWEILVKLTLHTMHTSCNLIPCLTQLSQEDFSFPSLHLSLCLLGSQNLMIIETGSHNFVQVEVYQKTWIFLILDWKKKQSSRSERPT